MAMLAIVVLITLVSAYMISDSLTRITAQVNLERTNLARQSMQEAKNALIAWSSSQAWSSNTNDQPGSLPCPDTDNDGYANLIGGACSSQIGRLPWKTINSQELRDNSGEILWYALSPNFRNSSGVTVINSDVQGQLTLYSDQQSTTTPILSNLVAILIAPGVAIAGQTRDPSSATALNTAANYLEGRNSGATGNYTSTPQSPASYPDTFNDQVLPLTQAELFSVVEPAVATRIERDIKPYLTSYYTQWSAFPFPSLFATLNNPSGSPGNPGTSGSGTNRAQSAFLGGTTASSGGLLPVTSAAAQWNAAGTTITLTGGTAASISGVTCTTFTTGATNYLRCDFNINPTISTACTGSLSWCLINPSFAVNGPVPNAGLSFVDLPDVNAVTVTSPSTGTNRTMTAKTLTGSLATSGIGTVRFSGTHTRTSTSSTARAMRVTIPGVTASALTSSSDPNAGWFISNEWFRQAYYAVSPGHLPGAGASCAALPATPSCLTVNSLPASFSQINDKRAILILTGRALNGSSRPSASLGNYLEGENLTPADFIFAYQAGTATSANDRVVVIAP